MDQPMKRKEITAAKVACRAEISDLMSKLRAISRVPERIINGSQGEAAYYKLLLEEMSKKKNCTYQHGSLSDLRERIIQLRNLYRRIT